MDPAMQDPLTLAPSAPMMMLVPSGLENVVDSPVVIMVINSTAHINDFCNKVLIEPFKYLLAN